MPITHTTQEFINGLKVHNQLNDYEQCILEKVWETPGHFIDVYIKGVSSKYKAKLALKKLVDLKLVYLDGFRFYPQDFSANTMYDNKKVKTNCLRIIEDVSRITKKDKLSLSSSTITTIPVSFGVD